MLFLEVSGLDPAFLSIATESQGVLHCVGDGEGHCGNSWGLSGVCDAGCWCALPVPLQGQDGGLVLHSPCVELWPQLPVGDVDMF